MTDLLQRSYLRDGSGPQPVDVSHGRDKGRSSSGRRKEGDDREKHRPKRNDSQRAPSHETNLQRQTTSPQNTNIAAERSSLELDVIGQPARGIQLGMPVETSVMISLRMPAADRVISTNNIDTSSLFALTSLVADTNNGERMPLEPGSLSGQKMFDSVHPIPEQCADTLARNDPCRLALGYFSFPGLLIRQAGTYRLRTTLVKMGGTAEAGATSLVAVDSEPISVDRRGSGTQRRHQRVYN